MQLHESGTRNSEPVASNNNPFTSQPWWRGMGQDNISQDMLGHGIENISPRETINNDLGSKTSKSQLKSGMDGGNDANKDMHITVMSQAGGKYGEQQPLMHTVSRVHPPLDEYVTPPSQLDLLGHNIACAPSTHSDLYYGGALPTYGHQALVHSQCVGVHSARMALPLEMTEEPVYVNAKQYHGILRRRQLRAKAELEKKLIKVRKPYLHESRHLHAMRRARGCGGRFVNAKKLDTEGSKGTPTSGTSCNIAGSTGPPNSSSAETVRTNYFRGSDSSVVHHKVTETQLHEMQLQQRYPSAKGQTDSDSNGDGCYPQYQGFQLFKYRSLSDTKVEERDFYGKQSDGIVANRAPRNRALTIK